jgi:hypothetical protein
MDTDGWLALLGTGGLLGLLLRPTIDRVFTWFFRPRLVIEFPGADPGCEVQTRTTGSSTPNQTYLKIRIRNRGRTTAQKVGIYGARLRYW